MATTLRVGDTFPIVMHIKTRTATVVGIIDAKHIEFTVEGYAGFTYTGLASDYVKDHSCLDCGNH